MSVKSLINTLFIAIFLLVTGCEEDDIIVPEKISLMTSSCTTAGINQDLKIKVSIIGKQKDNPGSASNIPAPKIKLLWKITRKPEGSNPIILTDQSTTDAGGIAEARISGIKKEGVYIVEVNAPEYPWLKSQKVTILGGITVTGNDQDGWAKGTLEHPIVFTATDSNGRPIKDVKFSFDLRKAPKGSKLFGSSGITGKDGSTSLDVKLGSKQGGGEIGVNIISAPWTFEDVVPALKIKFFSIDIWRVIFGVAGGLAIFIYGMRLMSDGLSLIAGDKLKGLLNFLTSNRFAAVGIGAVVTGFIQSSSACTVMVIGFVNAGLMSLEQAIGVVMGANIGTTITAQMLSFKLTSLAPIAVSIGVLMSVTAKKSNIKFIAQILVGFGLLFFGMQMMSGPLKELKDAASVKNIFDGLSCLPDASGFIPLMPFIKAIIAGTVLTVIVQSSSASIGLLLTLAGAGLIDVYAGFGILLGTNIGTTITAILAAIGSTKTAKRTACAHVIFNIAGTVAMIALMNVQYNSKPIFLSFIADFTAGDPFTGENLPRFLANAHTIFNIGCTAIFIWLLTPLATFTRFAVKDGKVPTNELELSKKVLDKNLLATPAIALEQAWYEISTMLDKGRQAIITSSESIMKTALINPINGNGVKLSDEEEFQSISLEVNKLEKDVDHLQMAVTDYVTSISQEVLTQEQGRAIPRLLHSVNDAERISDHSIHILRLSRRIRKRSLKFSPEAVNELNVILNLISELFKMTDNKLRFAYKASDTGEFTLEDKRKSFDAAKSVANQLKERVNTFRKAHVARHESHDCDIRSGVIYLDMLQNLNRAGGHLFNIIQAIDNC